MNRNTQRTLKLAARNFGLEAQAVRGMPCIVETAAIATGQRYEQLVEHGWKPCGGIIEAAHVGKARGKGGCNSDRFKLGPLCRDHHYESGERGRGEDSKRRKFEVKYSVDLVALADQVALEHARPLGILGLADRWVWWHSVDDKTRALALAHELAPERLEGYERGALLGWVRRRMMAVSIAAVGAPDLDRENLVTDMLYTLGGAFEESSHGDDGPAWGLCVEAGWPS